jgi:hypothetical protein
MSFWMYVEFFGAASSYLHHLLPISQFSASSLSLLSIMKIAKGGYNAGGVAHAQNNEALERDTGMNPRIG